MESPRFSKALIALDFTIMDGFILEYMSKYYKHFGIEEILFLHVIKNIDNEIEDADLKRASELAMDDLREELQKSIDSYGFDEAKTEINIQENSPTDTILELSSVKEIDLIVMGRKRSLKGSGIVSSHIARKSPASILFITQYMVPSLHQILVPVDYSEHSKLALLAAKSIANENTAVDVLNVYDVPFGYSKLGKTFEEMSEIMKGHAENDYKKFLAKDSLDGSDFKGVFYVKESDSKMDIVLRYAIQKRCDLIILGSRGRTSSSAILLGSFAEKMIYSDADVPVLIVKKKGENMGLLQTLFKL